MSPALIAQAANKDTKIILLQMHFLQKIFNSALPGTLNLSCPRKRPMAIQANVNTT